MFCHDSLNLYKPLKEKFVKSDLPASDLDFLLVGIQSHFMISIHITASLNPMTYNYFFISQVNFRASRFLHFKSHISFLFWKICFFDIEFFLLHYLCETGDGMVFLLILLGLIWHQSEYAFFTRPVIAILPIWIFKQTKKKNTTSETKQPALLQPDVNSPLIKTSG